MKWFGSTNSPEAAASADPDGDGARNDLEFMTGTDPSRPASVWRLNFGPGQSEGVWGIYCVQPANRATDLQWTTNLTAPGSWQLLDTTGNRPFYPATNRWSWWDVSTRDLPEGFFRARVLEP